MFTCSYLFEMSYNTIDGTKETSAFLTGATPMSAADTNRQSMCREFVERIIDQFRDHTVRSVLVTVGLIYLGSIGYTKIFTHAGQSTLVQPSSSQNIYQSSSQNFPMIFPTSTESKAKLQPIPPSPVGPSSPAVAIIGDKSRTVDELFSQYIKAFPDSVSKDDLTSPGVKAVFLQNIERIDKLNQASQSQGGANYALTKFSLQTFRDLDRLKGYHGFEDDEFIRMAKQFWHSGAPSELSSSTYYYDYYDLFFEELSGYIQFKPERMCGACGRYEQVEQATLLDLPDSFDWRPLHAVTPVRDQGRCGASYAFAVADNIAAAWYLARHNHNLMELSPQYIASCGFFTYGCMGGSFAAVFPFIHDMGIFTEELYPFEAAESGHSGWCKGDMIGQTDPHALIHSWTWIPVQNHEELKLALVKNGPLVVGINSNNLEFYHSGVDSGLNCDAFAQDHAMLLVGWGGKNEGQKEYWILKNSWGTDWGEAGYWRVAMENGACGITGHVMTAFS